VSIGDDDGTVDAPASTARLIPSRHSPTPLLD
jgi:hypothetical protein